MIDDAHENEEEQRAEEQDPFFHTFDAMQIYIDNIRKKPLLQCDEELNLARRARNGDFSARQKMIEHNLRLVVKVARHYANRGVALLDLIEEGNLGLMHALEKYDPELGYRFSTYATWWIRQNIERAIMNQSRTIRLPVHVVKEINSVLKARHELENESARDFSDEKVAEKLGIPVEDVRWALKQNERTISLDAPLDIDPMLSVGESIPDEQNPLPDELLENARRGELVEKWLADLNARQRSVIEKRFGFHGEETMTLEEIAKSMELTRERIRQIQIEALAVLRKQFQKEGIRKQMLL